MGAKSRTKGRKFEQDCVNLAKKYNLHSERTWQLAQSRNLSERACDITIESMPFQCKMVKRLPSLLRGGELQHVLGTMLRENSGKTMVLLDAEFFLNMWKANLWAFHKIGQGKSEPQQWDVYDRDG